jgi:pyruvate dehydrogenase E2 component (dihydrolipoamide acetyltransferase)
MLEPVPVAAPEWRPEAAGEVRASPAARRLAAERGVDLTKLTGSGPGGAILRSDVEQAAAEPAPAAAAAAPEAVKGKPRAPDLAAMRRAIAAAMARSKREIPHYYVSTTIDLGATQDHLARLNAERAPTERILLSVPLLKAVALALRKFPEFNGVFEGGTYRPSQAIHCGAAVALRGGGLIAPAIHDTDRCDLGELMGRVRDLVQRARGGGLRSSELSDPTVTVSSLGERGVETVFAVIYPPQVAIIGFGTPVVRPWVRDGRIEPRTVVTASLAADHRVSDGHRGALLLAEIERQLQEPEVL